MSDIAYYLPDANIQYYAIQKVWTNTDVFLVDELNLMRSIKNDIDQNLLRKQLERTDLDLSTDQKAFQLAKARAHGGARHLLYIQEPEIRNNRLFARVWSPLTGQDIYDFYQLAKAHSLTGASLGVYATGRRYPTHHVLYRNQPISHSIRQRDKHAANVRKSCQDFSLRKNDLKDYTSVYGNVIHHINRLQSCSFLPDDGWPYPRARRSSGWKNTTRPRQYKTKWVV